MSLPIFKLHDAKPKTTVQMIIAIDNNQQPITEHLVAASGHMSLRQLFEYTIAFAFLLF